MNYPPLSVQVKKFVGEVDDMLQWINELRTELKSGTPFGALPDTAKEQFEKFQVCSLKNKLRLSIRFIYIIHWISMF